MIDRVEDLHAHSLEVARAVAYVRAGGPLGDERVRRWLGDFEAREAMHNTFCSFGDLDGLPTRRVGRLPDLDPSPVAWSMHL